jgi:hypothetical protein
VVVFSVLFQIFHQKYNFALKGFKYKDLMKLYEYTNYKYYQFAETLFIQWIQRISGCFDEKSELRLC